MVSSISCLLQFLQWFKKPIYKLRNNTINKGSVIDKGAFLRDCAIGTYCYIGRNCVINSAIVGNYTCIAAGTQIGGMEHSIHEISTSPTLMGEKCILGKKTIIGYDVWIGANVIIKQGVNIGEGAVVGAGSFVNKDVEPYSIVVGSPAKLLRYRECKSIEQSIRKSEYWKYPPSQAKYELNKLSSNYQ